MAFKRSAVRSRLSPPKEIRFRKEADFFFYLTTSTIASPKSNWAKSMANSMCTLRLLLMILIPSLFLAVCAVVFAVKKSAEIWQKRLPLWYNEISQYKRVWQ